MELLGDPVAALDHAARMVGAGGRVLPMAGQPVGIEADVRGADPRRPGEVLTVVGQHAVAVDARPGRGGAADARATRRPARRRSRRSRPPTG